MFGASQSLLKYKVTRLDKASSQRIVIGTVAELSFERTSPISISAWVRTTVSGGVIFSKNDTAGSFPGYVLFLSTRWRIGFGTTINTAAEVITSDSSALLDGLWHHIVGTYDGSSDANNMHVYIDGVDEALTIVDNDLTSSILNTAPAQIGARGGGSGSILDPMSGDVQDVAVFAAELTQDDVTALYNRGCPPDILDLSLSASPAWYGICGEHKGDTGGVAAGVTSGTTVPDLSGNGNNGTLTGGPTTVTRL